jgi:hypothetical protein
MKTFYLITIATILFSISGFAQTSNAPVKFRVEKQAMSTPMTEIDDVFFMSYYYTKPVNVEFDGKMLNMYYDNGRTFTKRELTEIDRYSEMEDQNLAMETIIYVDNNNPSDTIMFVVDFNVSYMQVALPTQNASGEYIGYTSYRQFVDNSQLAYFQ